MPERNTYGATVSRGAGQVMRAVLDALARLDMADSITLTGEVYGRQTVTLSEASSVRRALRALEDRGQAVDMGRGFRGGRRMWATPDRAAEYRGKLTRAGLTP